MLKIVDKMVIKKKKFCCENKEFNIFNSAFFGEQGKFAGKWLVFIV
jgi:hypothetical protein